MIDDRFAKRFDEAAAQPWMPIERDAVPATLFHKSENPGNPHPYRAAGGIKQRTGGALS